MSSSTVSLAPQISLSETFSDMPAGFRSYVLSGFRLLAALPQSGRLKIAEQILEKSDNNRETELDVFAGATGLSEEDAGPVISMASLVLAIISTRSDSTSQIVQGLMEAKLLLEADSPPASDLIEYLASKRPDIKRSMRLSGIADRVLPSFRGINTAVEVRLGYKEGKVEAAVPIVVAHLHTDKDGNEVHFQMTRADVESLKARFDDLMAKISAAEEWMKGAGR